ncbi:MAG TPA: PQQ-binding-like beta-propeller repeat protein [Gemmata sp.]|nr:PQQ-binding-like beta-propeller repeat protein [Gemmata sp.]
MRIRLAGLLVVGLLLSVRIGLAGDWPGWRGPTGMGQVEDKNLPLTWGGKDNENVIWKVALPGQEEKAAQDQNQSSPIVSRDRVIVTMSYWPSGKADPKQFPEHHVGCYQVSDGKLLWDITVPPGPWLFSDLRGGYTAPTPAADGERIYVVFGSAVMVALAYDGKTVWRKEITPYKFDVAFAASPVLFEETIILQCDQVDKGSRLAGYDRKTGDVKWEEKRPNVSFGHSTPVLAKIGGKAQLLVSASNALQGVDPASGKLLWTCAAKGDTVSPVLGTGLVYCDSGRGGPGLAVDPSGMGDVTESHLKWTIPQVKEGYSSPVISGEYLYRLQNPEVVGCFRLFNGRVVYSERMPGVSASSSPIATPDGRIYLASAGKTYVLKAGPKLDILATNDLGDSGPASPAVADGKLFLKGRKWLFCVGAKP